MINVLNFLDFFIKFFLLFATFLFPFPSSHGLKFLHIISLLGDCPKNVSLMFYIRNYKDNHQDEIFRQESFHRFHALGSSDRILLKGHGCAVLMYRLSSVALSYRLFPQTISAYGKSIHEDAD